MILFFSSILHIIIFFQDWKYRAIHVILLLGVFLLGILQSYYVNILGYELLKSLAYVLGSIGLTYLVFVVKNRTFFNPFKQHLGIGDVMYLIVVIPYFTFYKYLFFFIGAMLFSIFLFYGLKMFGVYLKTIPLAGFMALLFIIISVLKITTNTVNCFYG